MLCGHQCYGCKDEKNCISCLNSSCKSYVNYFHFDKDSDCTVCSEALKSGPVVQLACKHFFHYHCVLENFKSRKFNPKISFNFDHCLNCKQWMEAPNNPDIQYILDEDKKLYKLIEEKCIKRMEIEGIDKDPRLSNKNDPYYGKALEYGMQKISYYMCYKCKNPYFAGLVGCEGGPGDNVNNENGGNDKFNPEHLICGGCVDLSGIAGETNCLKHGMVFSLLL